MNHPSGRIEKLVEQVMDPKKYPAITLELINKISPEVVTGALEKREAEDELTGEWIVFAKHGGQNNCPCLTTHDTVNQNIYDGIKSAYFHQFPVLNPVTA